MTRGMHVLRRRGRALALAGAAAALGVSAGAPAAGASPLTCSGTLAAPGVLAGSYAGNVSIQGVCDVDEGPATVSGNLTVDAGATLVAAYGLDDHTHAGNSDLTVKGNLHVDSGATALLGCGAEFPCLDVKEGHTGTVRIERSVTERSPLGVVLHYAVVLGSVTERGGGGGVACEEPGQGIFAKINNPVYSAYEDSTISGNLSVRELRSCWLGFARLSVAGSLSITGDRLFDPDAIEILSNHITRNLTCRSNTGVWDSTDFTGELWPRRPEANTVGGARRGECVLSSPAVEGGPLGPGPF